jgi:molecular chaperone GrpE
MLARGLARSLRRTTATLPATTAKTPFRWFSTEKKEAAEDTTEAAAAEAEATTTEDSTDPLSDANALVEELQATLATEKEEARKQYMSVLAEMENVRRIARNDVEKEKTYAIQKFAKNLLGTTDNLARAIEAVPTEALEGAPPALVSLHEGVVMTEKELLKVLKSTGIEKFGVVGDEFDPNRHEAMFEYEDSNLTPGSIGQVISAGYLFKDRVLRPAQVGFIKKA